jgi:hypothetical protein
MKSQSLEIRRCGIPRMVCAVALPLRMHIADGA